MTNEERLAAYDAVAKRILYEAQRPPISGHSLVLLRDAKDGVPATVIPPKGTMRKIASMIVNGKIMNALTEHGSLYFFKDNDKVKRMDERKGDTP